MAALLDEKATAPPKLHRASRRLEVNPKWLIARNSRYRGGDVQEGYEAVQMFRTDYPHGPHSLLTAPPAAGAALPDAEVDAQAAAQGLV